ncbi:MAG: hypothetical protein HY098_09610 [Nitrospinae bacterium]|nr:hypothetical protein [Nitrospinota bacterium]
MVRKVWAVVQSVVLVFMFVFGPLMADARPASAAEHTKAEMGTSHRGNCHGEAEPRGGGEPAVPAGHNHTSNSACCSIICNGSVLTAPSFTPELFLVAIATSNYLQIIPTNQSVLFYHPPKA